MTPPVSEVAAVSGLGLRVRRRTRVPRRSHPRCGRAGVRPAVDRRRLAGRGVAGGGTRGGRRVSGAVVGRLHRRAPLVCRSRGGRGSRGSRRSGASRGSRPGRGRRRRPGPSRGGGPHRRRSTGRVRPVGRPAGPGRCRALGRPCRLLPFLHPVPGNRPAAAHPVTPARQEAAGPRSSTARWAGSRPVRRRASVDRAARRTARPRRRAARSRPAGPARASPDLTPTCHRPP